MGFFHYVRCRYGPRAAAESKQLTKDWLKLTKYKNKRMFLMRCRDEGMFPNFINNSILVHTNNNKILNSIFTLKYSILINSLKDCSRMIKNLEYSISFLIGSLSIWLSRIDLEKFLNSQFRKNERIFNEIKTNNIKKINKLIQSHSSLFHNFKTNVKNHLDSWFQNITGEVVDQDIAYIFALGPNFSIPCSAKQKNKFIIEFVSSLESKLHSNEKLLMNIQQMDSSNNNVVQEINSIRKARFLFNNLLYRFKSLNVNSEVNVFYNRLYRDIKSAKSFLKNNPHLLLVKADKGKSSVLILKEDYKDKMLSLIQDENTYTCLHNYDPTPGIQKQNNNIAKNLKESNYIDVPTYKSLICHNGNVSKMYGLVKIHKLNYPLRPVVDTSCSPTYNLASFISKLLKPLTTSSPFSIKDSFSLVKKLSNIQLSETQNHKLISLDIVSLFTNTPIEIALKYLESHFQELNSTIPFNILHNLINFVFNNSVFIYDGLIYKQIFGCPMGSPLSPVIANLAMFQLEKDIVLNLNFEIPIYIRYVDDILLCLPEDKIQQIFNAFNNFNERLKFTVEIPTVNSINFLDITIIMQNDRFITNWYRKDTWSGRYLNFYSYTPLKYKMSVITALVDRAILLSDPQFHETNLALIRETLNNNNYPPKLVNNAISKRQLILLKSNSQYNRNTVDTGNTVSTYVRLPFDAGMERQANTILKELNIIPAWYSFASLKTVFSTIKDLGDPLTQSGLVYRISCLDCDAVYLGETKQYLSKRIYQHKYHITRANILHSTLVQHAVEEKHVFDFDNTQILHRCGFHQKRLIQESMYIHLEPGSINSRTEIDGITSTYKYLL